ncbi:MAG TPA: hypothetical protein VNT54_10930 [Solirubrobacteraceae bacterium]|nr:hypothetical protein [Solirubrobacteraceae bacterium]
MLGDAVPPLLLAAAGIVLWISAAVASAGAAIQANGVTLLLAGLLWLVAELRYARGSAAAEEPVLVRDRRR